MERSEVKQEYTWKTEDIFASDEEWEKLYKEAEAELDFSAYKGTLGTKAGLLAYLAKDLPLGEKLERLYLYAHMKMDQDTREAKYNAYVAKMLSLFGRYGAEVAFAEPELTALPEATLAAYIADPDLADYDYMLQRILKSKAHILSEAEERILAATGEVFSTFSNTFAMIDNANLNLPKTHFGGKEVQLTHGLYGVILRSGAREERREAFEKYYAAYRNLKNVIASTYFGNVKKDVFNARVRKYDSCLQMALENEDADPVVYENLIQTVHESLPIMHKYMRIRKALLGEQHMYDAYLPLVENAELSLDYEEAYALVVKGLAPLGEDYCNLLKRAKDERWIDVCETEGKRSGAYSTGCYGLHPFVLLNYQPTTSSIFTIAHEMGHSIHTYKSNEAQPFVKAQYRIFVAEVASTVNEVLLLKYLYNHTDDVQFKKYLLNYYMDMFRTTLYRQTMFAEFEQIAHAKVEAGEPLNNENLSAAYYELNKQYYGDGVIHDTEIESEWSRIPHFYTSFYVYKYATGIISAISIARRILTEGESAVSEYFRFLSAGGSTNPVDILKIAGVDLTKQDAFRFAMQEFAETVAEFAKLTGVTEV